MLSVYFTKADASAEENPFAQYRRDEHNRYEKIEGGWKTVFRE